jgi:hypothetical protein
MKYLYQELQEFEADLSRSFEDEDLKEQLDKITENDYFEEILELCEEIVHTKKVMIEFGYDF